MKKRNLMLLSAIAAASILMTGCGFTADDPADSQAVTITPEPTDTPAPTATPDATETPSATATPTDSTVTVKASKVQSAKRSKKRTKAVVKVKSVNDITGYQISYSTSKSFNTATKTVNSKKTKITISNLTKKNVYYIKVRTYKTVNKKKYYSKWSSVKKLK